jgi:hypothetical protein
MVLITIVSVSGADPDRQPIQGPIGLLDAKPRGEKQLHESDQINCYLTESYLCT